MRNSKKLFAVIMAVAMLASLMVPALAAEGFTYEADAKKLYDLGLFKGISDSAYEPALGDTLIRETGLALMIRASGKEAEVLAMTEAEVATQLAKIVDANEIADWAKPYAAYAVKNGLTNGIDASILPMVKFGAKLDLTGKEFINFMLKAMGYLDTDWDLVLTKAAEIGMLSAGEAVTFGTTPVINRDAAVGIMAGALGGTTSGGILLAQKLVEDGAVTAEAMADAGYFAPTATPTEVPVALAVEDVTADNLIEVLVVFNKAVDKDAAEDEDNYSINGVTIDKAKLQDDGVSVLLTLDDAEPLENDTEYTLEIGSALVEAEVDFTPYDFEVPVAQSIELTGPDTFSIKFSEPIANTDTIVVEIDDGVYSGVPVANGTRTVKVSMGVSSLEEGEYKVVISGAKDFADYTAPRKTFTLNYVVDDSVPTAVITSIDRTEVVIEWNVAVEGADGGTIGREYFYHSYSSYKPDADNGVERDGKEFTLNFKDNPLPEGKVKIVIDYDAIDDEEITSVWGVPMAGDLILTGEVVDDTTAPEVSKIVVDSEDTIVVYFNEGMDQESVEKADNYVVKKDGKEIDEEIISADYDSDDKAVTLVFDGDLDGNYTIDISGVKDDALEGNKIVAITLSFTVVDTTGINLNKITVEAIEGTDTATLIVRFPDDMLGGTDVYSVLNKDNYQISYGAGFEDLAKNDKIVFFSGINSVKITLDDTSDYDIDALVEAEDLVLRVGRVSDKVGNRSPLLSADIVVDAATAPAPNSVILTSYKTVELTFKNTNITSAPVTGFKISSGANVDKAPAGVKLTTDSKKSVITLTLRADNQIDDDATDFTDDIEIEIVAGKVKLDTGLFLENDTYTATDGIAPKIKTIAQTDSYTVGEDVYNYQILVTFTEDIKITSEALAATEFVVLDDDGDELVAGVDFVIIDDVADDDELVIRLLVDVADGDKISVDTDSTIKYIFDADGEGKKLQEYGKAKVITIDADFGED